MHPPRTDQVPRWLCINLQAELGHRQSCMLTPAASLRSAELCPAARMVGTRCQSGLCRAAPTSRGRRILGASRAPCPVRILAVLPALSFCPSCFRMGFTTLCLLQFQLGLHSSLQLASQECIIYSHHALLSAFACCSIRATICPHCNPAHQKQSLISVCKAHSEARTFRSNCMGVR